MNDITLPNDIEQSISRQNKELLLDHLQLLKDNLELLTTKKRDLTSQLRKLKEELKSLQEEIVIKKKEKEDLEIIDETLLLKRLEKKHIEDQIIRLRSDLDKYKNDRDKIYTHKYVINIRDKEIE